MRHRSTTAIVGVIKQGMTEAGLAEDGDERPGTPPRAPTDAPGPLRTPEGRSTMTATSHQPLGEAS